MNIMSHLEVPLASLLHFLGVSYTDAGLLVVTLLVTIFVVTVLCLATTLIYVNLRYGPFIRSVHDTIENLDKFTL